MAERCAVSALVVSAGSVPRVPGCARCRRVSGPTADYEVSVSRNAEVCLTLAMRLPYEVCAPTCAVLHKRPARGRRFMIAVPFVSGGRRIGLVTDHPNDAELFDQAFLC